MQGGGTMRMHVLSTKCVKGTGIDAEHELRLEIHQDASFLLAQ